MICSRQAKVLYRRTDYLYDAVALACLFVPYEYAIHILLYM